MTSPPIGRLRDGGRAKMRGESPTRSHLAAAPHHRFHQQMQFLRMFPAYTVEGTETRLTLWYRGGQDVRALTLEAVSDGVAVTGDLALARRVLNADARPLFPEGDLPSEPPAHRRIYRRYAGIRPVLFPAFFEGIAWTILGQQITISFAVQLKDNLARRYGRQVDGIDGPVWVFPGPGDLARASLDDLRSLKLSRQKAEALVGLGQVIDSGRWDPETALQEPTAAALEHLLQFRGIGPWTAQYILLRVAGHPDVLPTGDAGLERAWARLCGAAGRADDRTLQEAGRAWAGWRSDFAFYLWLDNLAERRRATGAPWPEPPSE